MPTFDNYLWNPYFDPNPVFVFTTLRIWCVIGAIFTAFAYFLIIFKSPVYKSKTFRYLLLYHLSIATVFQFYFTTFCVPLVYLPYVAFKCIGILTSVGVPQALQLAVLVHLIIAATAALSPLFYYRMDNVIPPTHVLHQKWIRYFVYIVIYGVCYILPIPLITLTLYYQDQPTVKETYVNQFHITFDRFFEPTVVAALIPGNPWAITVVVLVITATVLATVVIFGCTYVIYHTLKSNSEHFSAQTKKHHQIMLISLLTLALIISSVSAFIVPFLVYAFVFNSMRADVINYLLVCAGGIYPAAVTGYIWTYKPYRRYLIKRLKGFIKWVTNGYGNDPSRVFHRAGPFARINSHTS